MSFSTGVFATGVLWLCSATDFLTFSYSLPSDIISSSLGDEIAYLDFSFSSFAVEPWFVRMS